MQEMRKENKEGENSHQIIDSVAQQICDHYCRFPHECNSEDELMAVCDKCPLVTRF